ncbi:beta-mannosidase [Sediminitomix flava]|nr:glycoside hydrolase family 2 protein [Sediminitomix flava]
MTIDKDWVFSQAEKKEWLKASVPGCVHTDLLKHNKIEDPFFGTNEKKVQWIDKKDWIYQTSFTVDKNTSSHNHQELIFEGLDTYADVYLNEEKILSANNMFRTWKVDVKNILKEGKNTLKIYFHSPIKVAEPLWDEVGYPLYAINDDAKTGGTGDKKLSVMTRKAGYQYGWDWGPRLVSSGIYRPITLKSWGATTIENVHYTQHNMSEKNVTVKGKVNLTSHAKSKAKVQIVDAKSGVVYTDTKVKLSKGQNAVSFSFDIKNPKLWWSNGLGEQNLYTLKAQVTIDGEVQDEKVENIGIRTIELNTAKDEIGAAFSFRLNGQDVFMKGTNYIPGDMFLDRVSDEKLEETIKACADANMNMIRVWGGGTYERDLFYDLCDKYGLLVWQDFMFACSLYPGDEAFVENVKAEVKDNVIRLRNHPSLAMWCGNNEIEWAWFGWGIQKQMKWSEADSTKIINDYFRLFTEEIPNVLGEYDNRDYWASSPYFRKYGDHLENEGDRHLWDVWKGPKAWTYYKEHVPRFMSEYGYQGYPEVATLKNYVKEEDMNLWSPAMRNHQKAKYGNKRILKNVQKEFDVNGKDDFEKFVYISQMYQAYDVKFAVETHRRNMPHCMGTLYWQVNDCWPVASWASIDYEGRWKAVHYAVRDSYKNVIVSISEENKDFHIYTVSDKLEDESADLTLKVMDFDGKVIYENKELVQVQANSSKFQFVIPSTLVPLNRANLVVVAELSRDGKVIDRNEYFSIRNKDLALVTDYTLEQEIVKNADNSYSITLKTDKLLRGVKLESQDHTGSWSDNYFDMLPGESVEVVWYPSSDSTEEMSFKAITMNQMLSKQPVQKMSK